MFVVFGFVVCHAMLTYPISLVLFPGKKKRPIPSDDDDLNEEGGEDVQQDEVQDKEVQVEDLDVVVCTYMEF